MENCFAESAIKVLDPIGDFTLLPSEDLEAKQYPIPTEDVFVKPTPEQLNGKFYIVRSGQDFLPKDSEMEFLHSFCTKEPAEPEEENEMFLENPDEEEQKVEEQRKQREIKQQQFIELLKERYSKEELEAPEELDETEEQEEIEEIEESSSEEEDNWVTVIKPRKSCVTNLVLDMVRTSSETDIKITIGVADFYCHQIVLKCFSKFFNAIPKCFQISLPPDRVTPLSFYIAYKWMIDPISKIPRHGILDLYSASIYLRIDDIQKQCWFYLDNSDIFFECSAFTLFLEAYKEEHNVIKMLMLSRISKFFLTLVATDDFLELSKADLCHLYSLNTIGVNSEAEAFLSLCRWILFDWENRREFLDEIFNLIRYELIDPTFYFDLRHTEGNDPIRHICENEKIAEWLELGVSYASIQKEYGKDPTVLHEKARKLNIKMPQQRQWIVDKFCTYHNRFSCKNFHTVTYELFSNYLKDLLKSSNTYWKTFEYAYDSTVLPCPICFPTLLSKIDDDN